MTQRGSMLPGISGRTATRLLVAVVLLVLARPAVAEVTLDTPTGLRVTIHTAEDVRERWLVEEDGRTWLRHPVAGEVELDTEQHPWTGLCPVDAAIVADALRGLRGFRSDLAVEIFLLPGFPAGVLSSFARREVVFLAPGLGEQAPETVAYLVTHELGHVFTWAVLDGRHQRWQAYRQRRGLSEQDDPAALPHAQRNREIVAEDFRFLFGSSLATGSGTIENPDLPLPTAVPGLADLLAGYLADPNGDRAAIAASRVYPNPCRDLAVVELDLGDAAAKALGQTTVLEIYDLRGRLVRRVEEGRVSGGRASVSWDGREANGRRAPAGLYLYRVRHGARDGSGRVLLVSGR